MRFMRVSLLDCLLLSAGAAAHQPENECCAYSAWQCKGASWGNFVTKRALVRNEHRSRRQNRPLGRLERQNVFRDVSCGQAALPAGEAYWILRVAPACSQIMSRPLLRIRQRTSGWLLRRKANKSRTCCSLSGSSKPSGMSDSPAGFIS
jgi:hypothetical protein